MCAAPYKGVIGCLQIFQLLSIIIVFGKKWFVAVLDRFKTAGIPRKWLQRNIVTMASRAVPAFIRQDSIRVPSAGEKVSSSRKRHDQKYLLPSCISPK